MERIRRSRRRPWLALLAGALVVSGCSPTPSPSPALPTVLGSPAALGSAAPTGALAGPAQEPARGTDAQPPTSAQKIQAAVDDGQIDAATGLLYRLYALFGDPGLPIEFLGARSNDHGAVESARRMLDAHPAEVRARVVPFLLRPTDPASYWNQAPTTATGPQVVLAAAHPPAAPPPATTMAYACVDGWMRSQVSPNIPVMISAQCTLGVAAAQATLEEARGDVAVLWLPETTLMGIPRPDRNVAGDDYPDTVETGDGLIDFYLPGPYTPSGPQATPRNIDIAASAYGVTYLAPPFEGPADAHHSSAYVVIQPGLTGRILEATIAHEFFHVLQFAHNSQGIFECRVGPPDDCQRWAAHWFVEASAAWSEHRFVVEARGVQSGPYDQWNGFRGTHLGLQRTNGQNEYQSWMWALFMQQEIGSHEVIGDTWSALEGKVSLAQVQTTIDAHLGFTDHFRDFAVRVWNQKLLPANPTNPPITPMFNDPKLDPNFPATQPKDARLWNTPLVIDVAGSPHRWKETLDGLASDYLQFFPAPGVHKLTFDFITFSPDFDVDALVRIGSTGWERRKLVPGETVWCLDNPKDAVEEGILVFSNHSQARQGLARDWSVTASEGGCQTQGGSLAYTAQADDGAGNVTTESASVVVDLRSADDSDPFAPSFVNRNSSYQVTTTSHVVMGEDVTGCQLSADSIGTGMTALGVDGVVGNLRKDADGGWLLTIAVSLPVHLETTTNMCALGIGEEVGDTTLSWPACDGVENLSASPASSGDRTFDFSCGATLSGSSWSLRGSVTLHAN